MGKKEERVNVKARDSNWTKRKPSSWRRWRRRRKRQDGGDRTLEERRFLSQHVQQVRASSIATGTSPSSWLEAPLCSSSGSAFSIYTHFSPSHTSALLLSSVGPRDICLLRPPVTADSICLCRFTLIQEPCFMQGSPVMWLHRALRRWHFNMTTAGRSILLLFYFFFIESKKKTAAMQICAYPSGLLHGEPPHNVTAKNANSAEQLLRRGLGVVLVSVKLEVFLHRFMPIVLSLKEHIKVIYKGNACRALPEQRNSYYLFMNIILWL